MSLLALLCCAVFAALPAHAADYDETLDRLQRLQTLAEEFSAAQDTEPDPLVLTLAYTRVGDYNTTIWQLTAGTRDPAFENYVTERDADLAGLQGLGSVTLPNEQSIDFGHLLAAMNLVYNGMPITGSWGGDCIQMVQRYADGAADADGYAALMSDTFALEDDGTQSLFGSEDLRADLDSVVAGSALKKGESIAALLRDYYDGLTDYDRAKQFIALSFGTTDTGDTAAFRETVYRTMLDDTGMQLLLYMSGMWSTTGWTLDEAYVAPLHGIANLFADYLADTVNHERIKSDAVTRMTTMAGQALADALAALGDNDAASAALNAASDHAASAASSTASGVVTQTLDGATEKLQEHFDVKIFSLVLLILAGLSLLGLIVSTALFFSHRKK